MRVSENACKGLKLPRKHVGRVTSCPGLPRTEGFQGCGTRSFITGIVPGNGDNLVGYPNTGVQYVVKSLATGIDV